jgi:DNA-dependent RNA polymerase auxiliary subunit epsilon
MQNEPSDTPAAMRRWLPFRDDLYQLYIQQDKTLKEVREEMREPPYNLEAEYVFPANI